MRRLVKEPLVHFLALGVVLFVLYGLPGRPERAPERSIEVTPARIQQLAAGFQRAWQRSPTEEELRGLVDDYIREEVSYREALAMGLDRDDTVIRRRLRQKVEFLTEDAIDIAPPTDEELRALLDSEPDRFRIEPRVSFRQIFINRDGREESAREEARRLLSSLEEGKAGDPRELGDSLLLDHEFSDLTTGDIRRAFGGDFAEQLLEVETGRWAGPLTSGYGYHIVQVLRRTEGRMPALSEIRESVEREWSDRMRREQREAFYADLLSRYEISIQWPGESNETGASR